MRLLLATHALLALLFVACACSSKGEAGDVNQAGNDAAAGGAAEADNQEVAENGNGEAGSNDEASPETDEALPETDEASPETDEASPETVEPLRVYGGRIRVSGAAPVGAVLRDQDAYEAFVGRIPEYQITRQRPAPPSNDPLLQLPAVDWDKEMILAVHRGENMHVGLEITTVELADDGTLHVRVQLHPIGYTDRMASVFNVGIYHAVVIPRHDGEVHFEFLSAEEDEEDEVEEDEGDEED